MSNERRSGAIRTLQPIVMLQETRYLSREELLREIGRRSSQGQPPATGAARPPRRGDGA